jgi:hypothetical protein
MIVVCKRWTWAETTLGKRYLLGATAFFKREDAVISKFWRLQRFKKMPYSRWELKAAAEKQLKTYKETGVMN